MSSEEIRLVSTNEEDKPIPPKNIPSETNKILKLDLNHDDDLKDWAWEFLQSFLHLDYEFRVAYSTFESRMNVCKTCEHFNEVKIKCMECGCPLLEKANEMLDECPLDKWGSDKESFDRKYFAEIASMMSSEYVGFEKPASSKQTEEVPDPYWTPEQKQANEELKLKNQAMDCN